MFVHTIYDSTLEVSLLFRLITLSLENDPIFEIESYLGEIYMTSDFYFICHEWLEEQLMYCSREELFCSFRPLIELICGLNNPPSVLWKLMLEIGDKLIDVETLKIADRFELCKMLFFQCRSINLSPIMSFPTRVQAGAKALHYHDLMFFRYADLISQSEIGILELLKIEVKLSLFDISASIFSIADLFGSILNSVERVWILLLEDEGSRLRPLYSDLLEGMRCRIVNNSDVDLGMKAIDDSLECLESIDFYLIGLKLAD
jgi:hypothetical protein